jgi:uncharacterized repeat protein (TIGR01451 family)
MGSRQDDHGMSHERGVRGFRGLVGSRLSVSGLWAELCTETGALDLATVRWSVALPRAVFPSRRRVGWALAPAGLLALLSLILAMQGATTVQQTPAPPIKPVSALAHKVGPALASMSLPFVANRGQLSKQVSYYLPGVNPDFFTSHGMTMVLSNRSGSLADSSKPAAASAWALHVGFLGGRTIAPAGVGATPTKINYLVGPKSTWRTSIPTFDGIVYKNVWPGIDVSYTQKSGKLEYSFLVHPGANPADVRLAYQGVNRISVDPDGALEVATPVGGFVDEKPVVYQTLGGRRVSVASAFSLSNRDSYGFRLGRYDASKPLVIDPVYLVYAGLFGSVSSKNGLNTQPGGIAVDSSGNAYVTGTTNATDLPVTTGAYLTTAPFAPTSFVAKINASGSAYDYVTYLGGSATTGGQSIAVNSSGNAYVVGLTAATNFPVTTGAFQTSNAGGNDDGFVTELNPSGSGLVYSTYLGGSATDVANGVALDSSGDAYVYGYTSSTQFPVTAGAYQTALAGTTNDFVTELNPTGTAEVYSTLIGGPGNDSNVGIESSGGAGNGGIAVNSSGDAYITGTAAAGFPTTSGAYGTSCPSTVTCAFVAEVNGTGTGLVYSTLIAGTNAAKPININASAIAIDASGDAFITGRAANGGPYPTTSGAYQTSCGSSTSQNCAFVTEVNPSGTQLVYSTYLSGSGAVGSSYGAGIAVDGSDDAYVQGSTTQTTFPTLNPFQATNPGAASFITELNPSGSGLVYSTFLSCTANVQNDPVGLALGATGIAYVTGFMGCPAPPPHNPSFPETTPTFTVFNNSSGSKFYVAALAISTNADLNVTDSASPASTSVTGSDTYTLNFANYGPAPANNVVVTDQLPSGVTFVSATPNTGSGGSCSQASGTVTCTYASLPSASLVTTGTYSVAIVVSPTKSGTFADSATITSDSTTTDPNLTNNSASASFTASGPPTADLLASSSAPAGSPGQALTYTAAATNNGPSSATNVVLTDTLPSSFTYGSATPSQGSCSQASGVVTCNLGTVAAGSSASAAISATPSASGTFANTVSVASALIDPNPANNFAVAATVVSTSAASVQIASASTPMTSTTNFTTAHATATCPTGTTLVGGGDELTRSGSPVPNDGAVTLGLNPSDGSGNTAPAGGTNPGSWTAIGGYSGQAPGTDTVTSFAVCASNLTSATVVAAQTTATDTLGPVTAVCPSGTSLIGGGGGYSSFPGSNNTKILDSYPSDAAGDVPTNGSTNPTAWTLQGESNNGTAETTTAVALCATDVTVPTEVVTASNNDDFPEGSYNTNPPGGVAGGTALPATAVCPTGTTLLDGGSYITSMQGGLVGGPGNGGQGVHVIGDFPSDSSGNPIASGSAGSWTLIGQDGGQNLDDLNVEAFGLCATSTGPSADISVTTDPGTPNPVSAGGNVTYSLNVTNNGPSNATGVTATDFLPAGTTFVSASSGCTNNSGIVTCAIGSLANGASHPLTVTVTAPNQATTLGNWIEAGGNQPDPSTSNNVASSTTTVNASADLSVSQSASPSPALEGGSVTYSETVSNAGPSDANAVTLTDTLPGTATFGSATPSQGTCSQSSGVVTCSLGTIAAGGTATISVSVTVSPSSTTALANALSVVSAVSDPNTANNSSSLTTSVTTATDLAVTSFTAAPNPVSVGGSLVYTAVVANQGAVNAAGATLTDALPAGVSYVSSATTRGSCSQSSGTVTCLIGMGGASSMLPSGGSTTVTITVKPTTPNPTLSNTVNASSTTADPNLANNTATVSSAVSQATSSTGTVVQSGGSAIGGSLPLGSSVSDQATVSGVGGILPSGNVTFAFFNNGTCAGIGSPVSGPGTLSAGIANSGAEGPLTAGSYSFDAVYGGDTNYTGSTSSCESFVVNQALPTTTTTVQSGGSPVAGALTLGSSASDQATVSGVAGIGPSGSVTFIFFNNGACSGSGTPGAPIGLVSGGASSLAQGPLTAGSYSYEASYGGDANYTSSTSSCEPFTVNQASSNSVTSVLDGNGVGTSSVALGSSVSDQATVAGTGAGTPTGNVTFTFFNNGTCSGAGSAGSPVGLDSGVANSGPSAPLDATGSYSFQASYGGDTNYTASLSACEPFAVTTAPSVTVTTVLNGAIGVSSAPLGSSLSDQATVSGIAGVVPSGTVTFTLFGNGTCSGTGTPGGSGGLTAGIANSSPSGPLTAGSYSYQAVYPGDANYAGSTGACEPFTVNQASTQTATTVDDAASGSGWSGTEVTGASAYDTSTVSASGGPAATGTVTYSLYANSTCTGSPTMTDTESLSGGSVPNSSATDELGAGLYSFEAAYGGDSNYTGSTSSCEPFDVGQASTSTGTVVESDGSPVTGALALGSSVSDQATVSGVAGIAPSTSVTFTFFANASCSGTGTIVPGAGTLAAGFANSGSEGPLTAGSYSFEAAYAGDSNYLGSTSSCEPLTVNQASSVTVTSVLNGSGVATSAVALASSVSDQATVSGTGAGTPTGNVTFTLFANDACSGSGTPGSAIALNQGVASSGSSGALDTAGGYSYQVSYAGDANYLGSTSSCEPFTVNTAPSTTVTSVIQGGIGVTSVAIGSAVTDQASVSGVAGVAPSGNVTFTLFTNGTCAGSGTPAGSGGLTAGVANSPPSPALNTAGSYSYQASYGGDANYTGSIGACEPFSVGKASATFSTIASGGVTFGAGTISDTATLAGGVNPTGTITFKVYGPDDPTCGNGALTTLTTTVSGNGSYSSGPFTPPGAGVYNWVSSYSGDSNNAAITGGCAGPPSVTVSSPASATQLMTAATGTATDATAPCASGTVLVGGGIRLYDATTAGAETNGLKVNGSVPSSSGGTPSTTGATDPSNWTAVGGFGGQADSNDDVTAYAMCASGGQIQQVSPPSTVVEVSSVNPSGVPDAAATATCPTGTVLVGGGGLDTPATSGNLKPIASFPSNGSGAAAADGSADPSSWTAVGGIMGSLSSAAVTTAFAVCSYDTALTSVVHVSRLLAQAPTTTDMPVTANCPGGSSLLDGGAQYLVNSGYPPSGNGYYGFHLTGDFPSSASGVPAADSTSATSWTGEVHPGGSTIPSVDLYAYALCAQSNEQVTIGVASATTATTVQSGGTPVTGALPLGSSVSDQATVSGIAGVTPTGNATFTFFTNGTCAGAGTHASPVPLGSGEAGSSTQGPLTAGSYSFDLFYGGDSNYAASASSCESFTVSKATTTTATSVLQNSVGTNSVALGSAVNDQATVSGTGAGTPTGSVTFTLFTNGTCTPSGTTGSPVGLTSGSATSSSSGALHPAGSYSYQATYSGDSNYTASTGACEPFTVRQASSSTGTVVDDAGIGSAWAGTEVTGASAYDTATVSASGGPAPTGSVTYSLFGGGTCSGTPTATDPVTLSGGSVPNSTATGSLGAGSYSFSASYSGDSNYQSSSSSCEPFSLAKAPSATGTAVQSGGSPVTGALSLGSTVSDQATVSGVAGIAPGGSVTFTFFTNGACSGTGLTVPGAGTIASGAASSGSEGPLGAGGYSFEASYGGDGNYSGSVSSCESFVVSKASSSTGTVVQSGGSPVSGALALGSSVSDQATVSGVAGITPGGSVTFTFFSNGTCNGAGVTVPGAGSLASGVANSGSEGPLGAGSYSFDASYAGDGNYTGSASSCEPLSVNQASSVTVTSVLNASGVGVSSVGLGSSVSDQATVSGTGAETPTGTVSFTFFANGTCGGTGSAGSPVGVSSGVATSGSSGPLDTTGSYSYEASYSGDGNYTGSTGTCEPFTVSGASSVTVTSVLQGGIGVGSVALGSAVSDQATVSGVAGVTPTGSVTFMLFANGTCAGTGTSDGPLGLTAGVATSASSGALNMAGSYSYQAIYAGDSNYAGSTATCEPFTVAKATPATTTVVQSGGSALTGALVLGSSVGDQATVSGVTGITPAGSVTFTLFTNGTCSGTGVTVPGAGTLASGVANSGSEGPLAAGSYSFKAAYGGDSNYNTGAGSSCEPFTVSQASSSTATAVQSGGAAVTGPLTLGSSVSDQATVSGVAGITPTGSVSFTFFSNGTCSGTGSTVPGAGTLASGVANSGSEGPLAAGGYSFKASYGGDSNYTGSTSACEPFTISKAPSSTVTNVEQGGVAVMSVALGSSVTDQAKVSGTGAGTPTATVTFTLFGNGTCSGTGTSGSPVGLTAGVANSGSSGALNTAGSYSYQASYGGDSNYTGSTGTCEPFTVSASTTPADLSIDKTASPDQVGVNGTLTYTLTVKNHGPGTATGVTVSDPLPATTTFVSDATSQGSCAGTTRVTCDVGTLANGATATITIRVTATTAGTITNTATVAGNQTDPRPGNNTDSVTTRVVAPDLDLRKTGSPNPVRAGATLTYTITVHNGGPGAATGVSVNDPLPTGESYQSASSSQGSCGEAAGTVTCAVGTLATGAAATITIKVTPTSRGTLTNTASVSATETGSNPADTATAQTKVTS